MANLTLTLSDQDKIGISNFCEQIGMTVSGLYNVFTKQVLRLGRIPFEIAVNQPNEETLQAMKETDEMLKNPNAEYYTNMNDLIEALEK